MIYFSVSFNPSRGRYELYESSVSGIASSFDINSFVEDTFVLDSLPKVVGSSVLLTSMITLFLVCAPEQPSQL